jgi:DNA-binding LacI/PurR family transcriptional regulator
MNWIEQELVNTRYQFVFASSNGRAEQSVRTIEMLTRRFTTGFVLMPFYESNTSQAVHDYLKVRGIPFVQVNYFNLPGRNDAPLISTNNFAAFKQLTEHLIALGHQRIALAYTSPDYSCMEARLRGYYAALEQAGLTPDRRLIIEIPREQYFNLRLKEETLNYWLRIRKPPTAIMSFKDDSALQFMELLRRRGLRTPEDMAVTGFDDYRQFIHHFCPEIYFKLTTVRQNLPEIGRQAVRRLIDEIESPNPRTLPLEIEVPAQLVIRGSCGGTPTQEETDVPVYPSLVAVGKAV